MLFIKKYVLSLKEKQPSIGLHTFKLPTSTYNLRWVNTKYRISAHCLRIQSGRYGRNAVPRNAVPRNAVPRNAVPRNERYCNCCNTFGIEDLYHFIIVFKKTLRINNVFGNLFLRVTVDKIFILEKGKLN